MAAERIDLPLFSNILYNTKPALSSGSGRNEDAAALLPSFLYLFVRLHSALDSRKLIYIYPP